MRQSLLLLPILASAAAAGPPAGAQRPLPDDPDILARHLFVSPAGEPFRRGEGVRQPLQAWFERADADHDGALTQAELEADFAHFFAVLDADHDGEIGPDEIARYEHDLLPEMRSGSATAFGSGMQLSGYRGSHSSRAADSAGRRVMLSGAARFGLLPISHPLMDADTNFNRGISPAEFTQAADRRFAMLDTGHEGRLTLEQLGRLRRQAFAPARRDAPALGAAEPAADSDEDAPRPQ